MIKMTSIVIVLMLASVFPDENNVEKHNVGAAVGFVTGYGLSYRHWFNRNGFQATCAPYYNKDQYGSELIVSLGATGLYKVKEAKYVDLLVYYGPHFWYYREKYRNHYYGINNSTVTSDTTEKQKSCF